MSRGEESKDLDSNRVWDVEIGTSTITANLRAPDSLGRSTSKSGASRRLWRSLEAEG